MDALFIFQDLFLKSATKRRMKYALVIMNFRYNARKIQI